MKNKLINLLVSLGLGLLMTILVGAFLKLVSLDMRLMTAWLLALAFTSGHLRRNKLRGHTDILINTVVLVLPFGLFYAYLIWNDLPTLAFMVPLSFLMALLPHYFRNIKGSLTGLVGAILFTAWLIPQLVGGDLSKNLAQQHEPFTLVDHAGDTIDSELNMDKVMILDFYGTWCVPCIKELPELAKVRDHYKDNPDVQFLIVNADQGGDNLEKALKFEEKRGNGFRFAYDYNQEVYKKLGLRGKGVPSLIILHNGQIRFLHVGYNTAETDFAERLIKEIKALI